MNASIVTMSELRFALKNRALVLWLALLVVLSALSVSFGLIDVQR